MALNRARPTRAWHDSSPASSRRLGIVSTARIEQLPLYRGGSASTETIAAASPFPFPACSLSFQGSAVWSILDCARRTSTVIPCAFREHSCQCSTKACSCHVSKRCPDWSPTARVQGGPSEAARCASTGDQRGTPYLYPSPLVAPPNPPQFPPNPPWPVPQYSPF